MNSSAWAPSGNRCLRRPIAVGHFANPSQHAARQRQPYRGRRPPGAPLDSVIVDAGAAVLPHNADAPRTFGARRESAGIHRRRRSARLASPGPQLRGLPTARECREAVKLELSSTSNRHLRDLGYVPTKWTHYYYPRLNQTPDSPSAQSIVTESGFVKAAFHRFPRSAGSLAGEFLARSFRPVRTSNLPTASSWNIPGRIRLTARPVPGTCTDRRCRCGRALRSWTLRTR